MGALESDPSFLQSLFDNFGDAVLVLNDAGRYVAANPAACRLLGYSREELLGLRFEDVLPRMEVQRGRELWRRLLAAGAQQGEVALKRRDGTVAELEYRAVARFLPGHHMSVLRDVAGRRRAAAHVRVEALATLAGGLAHHLNGLLTVIQLGLDEAAESGAAREPLEQAGGGVRRAAALVRRLLLYSRTQRPMRRERVDLTQVVPEVVDGQRRALDQRPEWTLRTTDEPLPVLGDRELLVTAIEELLANACEAALERPESARVRVQLEGVSGSSGRLARMVVEDSGPGMPPEVRHRVFDPFFTTRDRARRAGLGASVAWGAVRAMDGWIDCTSRPGLGTSFEIHIPLAPP